MQLYVSSASHSKENTDEMAADTKAEVSFRFS